MPVVGGEEPRALGAQRCVLGRGERRVGGEHCTGRVARVVDGGHVRAEVGDRIVFRMVCLAWALSVRKTHVSFQLQDVPIPKRYVGRIQAEEDNIKSKVRK